MFQCPILTQRLPRGTTIDPHGRSQCGHRARKDGPYATRATLMIDTDAIKRLELDEDRDAYAAYIREVTDDGQAIVDCLIRIMEDDSVGAKPHERLEAQQLLDSIAFGHVAVEQAATPAPAADPPPPPEPASPDTPRLADPTRHRHPAFVLSEETLFRLPVLVKQKTDMGKKMADFLNAAVRGELSDFRPPPLDQGRQAPVRPRLLQGPRPPPRATGTQGRGHQGAHTDPHRRIPGAEGPRGRVGDSHRPRRRCRRHSALLPHLLLGRLRPRTRLRASVPRRLAPPRMPMRRGGRRVLRAGPRTPPPIPGPPSIAPQPPRTLPNRRVQPREEHPLAPSQSNRAFRKAVHRPDRPQLVVGPSPPSFRVRAEPRETYPLALSQLKACPETAEGGPHLLRPLAPLRGDRGDSRSLNSYGNAARLDRLARLELACLAICGGTGGGEPPMPTFQVMDGHLGGRA